MPNATNKKMEQDLPPLPPYFFKYRPFDGYTKEVILESKIYFQSPANFNDPFDGRIPLILSGTDKQWRQYLLRLYKESYPDYSPSKRLQLVTQQMKSHVFNSIKNRNFDHIVDSLGVCCLSANETNILMWAHYADSHKGVCLRFNPQNAFFLRAQKIIYSKPYPTTTIFDDHLDRLQAMILTKSDDWSYEEEWRILETERGPGLYQFSPSSLDAIIVGCNASKDDIEQVVSLSASRSVLPPSLKSCMHASRIGTSVLKLTIKFNNYRQTTNQCLALSRCRVADIEL